MESVRSVFKLSTESVGNRRELVAHSVHTVLLGALYQNELFAFLAVETCRRVLGYTLNILGLPLVCYENNFVKY